MGAAVIVLVLAVMQAWWFTSMIAGWGGPDGVKSTGDGTPFVAMLMIACVSTYGIALAIAALVLIARKKRAGAMAGSHFWPRALLIISLLVSGLGLAATESFDRWLSSQYDAPE